MLGLDSYSFGILIKKQTNNKNPNKTCPIEDFPVLGHCSCKEPRVGAGMHLSD